MVLVKHGLISFYPIDTLHDIRIQRRSTPSQDRFGLYAGTLVEGRGIGGVYKEDGHGHGTGLSL